MKKLFAFIIVVFLAMPFFAQSKKYTLLPEGTSKDVITALFDNYKWDTLAVSDNIITYICKNGTTLKYFGQTFDKITFCFDKQNELVAQTIIFKGFFDSKSALFIILTSLSREEVLLMPPTKRDEAGHTFYIYSGRNDKYEIDCNLYGDEDNFIFSISYKNPGYFK